MVKEILHFYGIRKICYSSEEKEGTKFLEFYVAIIQLVTSEFISLYN